MISDELLTTNQKVVGLNQTKKAVKSGTAKKIYVAYDAEESFIASIKRLCEDSGVPIDLSATMTELKFACQIDVDCAVCTVVE